MDPITLITTALVAGAVAASKDVAAQAVKDAYAGLKALIVRKFGDKSDAEDAMAAVEKRPDSEARQAMLAEELSMAKAAEDAEVLKQAQALLDMLKDTKSVDATNYAQQIQNSILAQGERAAAASSGGVAISGEVGGSINTAEREN
jgi:hypothetical protein